INPNTVLKAYRELEYEELVAAKPGVGTFVTKTLSEQSIAAHQRLSGELNAWIGRAQQAGLDFESIEALFQRALRSAAREEAV
ncbi:MAG: GntR family transcriptional regulator, partial [Actinobacteria bacterium]|nr:GntR family transcriptional regulator [Actinomycetota bacterium]